jgi:vitamin B12 transporter
MSSFITRVAVAAVLSSTPGYAFAQSAGDETIIVTGTRIPTELSRVGESVTVITGEELEQRQTRFVMDALTLSPGISINQFGARGTDSSVQMRGQGGEGTLVVIDGVEVSDPSRSQTAFDFSQLLAGDIGRIEVLRGSQSVLYGGDAVGGVINIITRRGEGPLSGQIAAEGGSYGTYQLGGRMRGGLSDDRLGYNIDVQYLETDGFSAADENLPGNSEGERYDNLSSSGRFDFQANDIVALNAAYRYARGTLNYDAFGGAFGDDPDVGDDFEQYSGRVGADFTFGEGFTGRLGAAYARNEREGFDNGASSYYYYGDRNKIDSQLSYAFNENHVLVGGADFEEESYESDGDPTGASVTINGYFLNYQTTLFDSLTLTVGGRIDDHERFGKHDSYRISAAYNPTDSTKLRASYATGFRAPSLFELFGVCCGDDLGNPDLTPEESESWDAGVTQEFFNGALSVDLTYFRVETKNEIAFDGAAFGLPGPAYFNVPGVTTADGWEAGLDWRIADALRARLTYTKTEIDVLAARSYRPEHLFSLDLNYGILDGRGNLNLNIRGASDITRSRTGAPIEDYTIGNVTASFDLTDQLEIYGRIENVTDEQYQTRYGYGTADRSAYAGLRVNF